MSHFRERLEAGKFVITTEMEPPKGTDLSQFLSTAALLKDKVHAVNVTDNQRAIRPAHPRGTRADFAGDLSGPESSGAAIRSSHRWVLGVRNVLAMTGDPVEAGDHPMAKPVFDVSSAALLQLIAQLNVGKDGGGHPLEGRTDFFCGATVNPCVVPLEPELKRFQEKVEAGARFFQTQAIYDLNAFARFMEIARKLPVYILAGLIPLRSARMARFLNEKVPGIHVPAAMIERLDKTSDPVGSGLAIAVELVEGLKELCQGIHLMVLGKEKDFEIMRRISVLKAGVHEHRDSHR
jgi:methylenetetrahydrofolate reductase (NADPH)